jgi:hypothetical protein
LGIESKQQAAPRELAHQFTRHGGLVLGNLPSAAARPYISPERENKRGKNALANISEWLVASHDRFFIHSQDNVFSTFSLFVKPDYQSRLDTNQAR